MAQVFIIENNGIQVNRNQPPGGWSQLGRRGAVPPLERILNFEYVFHLSYD